MEEGKDLKLASSYIEDPVSCVRSGQLRVLSYESLVY